MTFRNEQGRLLNAGLFIDKQYDESTALYALTLVDKQYKGKTYPALYRLYIEMSDITEYNFANTYFESFQHWESLCSEEWFKPYITRWRKELELKIKAEALKEIIAQAASDDPKKRLEASKYIYEKVFVSSSGKGRPTKAQIKEEAVRKAQEEKLINEDWNRLVN